MQRAKYVIILISMSYLIGEQLGAMIAHFEKDLSDDVDDLVTLQKLALTSETFKNFSQGNLEGFKEAFDRGYASASRDLHDMEQRRQAEFLRVRGSNVGSPDL